MSFMIRQAHFLNQNLTAPSHNTAISMNQSSPPVSHRYSVNVSLTYTKRHFCPMLMVAVTDSSPPSSPQHRSGISAWYSAPIIISCGSQVQPLVLFLLAIKQISIYHYRHQPQIKILYDRTLKYGNCDGQCCQEKVVHLNKTGTHYYFPVMAYISNGIGKRGNILFWCLQGSFLPLHLPIPYLHHI